MPYEGACKERCDKFRLGGTDAYKLDCADLFSSSDEEKTNCINDCKQCPAECPEPNRYSYDADREVLACPEADSAAEDTDTDTEPSKDLIIAIVFAVLTALLVAVIFYCQTRRKRGAVVQDNAGVVTSTQRIQYQPSQMPIQLSQMQYQPSQMQYQQPTTKLDAF